MKKQNLLKKLTVALLLPFGAALVYFSLNNAELVEKLYSKGVYPPIGRFLSRLTGIFPFSLAELCFIFVPAAFVIYSIIVLLRFFQKGKRGLEYFLSYAVNLVAVISIGFFTFLIIWGLNYYRLPFASIAGLEVKPASAEELESLCDSLIDRANALREKVSTYMDGSFVIPGSRRDILNSCYKGYEAISSKYPVLAGRYGNPKPVLLSGLMNYTGICGIYFPFTGEANVNVAIPLSTLPSTASHEMAHQRGFAREEEANFISYLACTAHPDVNYQYSGMLLALTNSMSALYKADPEAFTRLSQNYSEGVRKDIEEIRDFWRKYEGPVERASEKINNQYLKANNQRDGVQSYGRMVDLLIAEYRQARQGNGNH